MSEEVFFTGYGYGVFKPKSRLWIADDLNFQSCQPMPGAWWRFWQWALLGWRWEKM